MPDARSLPLYLEVADKLRNAIQQEQWHEKERLSSEVDLAEYYHVSRVTIRKAIEELIRENFLYRIRGKGTFIRAQEGEDDHFTIAKSFTRELKELGISAKTINAEVGITYANKQIASALHTRVGNSIFYLRRLRGDGTSSFAYFETYVLNYEKLSLHPRDYYGSFYTCLNKIGIHPKTEKEYVEAILPDLTLQRTLRVGQYEPILKRVRYATDEDTGYREYSECFYIGSSYRYYFEFC